MRHEASIVERCLPILERARYTSRHRTEAFVVKVLDRNIAKSFPAVQPAAALYRPVIRLDFCIFHNSSIAIFPNDAVVEALDIGVYEDVVGIRAAYLSLVVLYGSSYDMLTLGKTLA